MKVDGHNSSLCHDAACGAICKFATECMLTSIPADFQGVIGTSDRVLDMHRFYGDLHGLQNTASVEQMGLLAQTYQTYLDICNNNFNTNILVTIIYCLSTTVYIQ